MARRSCSSCSEARATVVYRVERKGEMTREFATLEDAERYDDKHGGGGNIYPVSK